MNLTPYRISYNESMKPPNRSILLIKPLQNNLNKEDASYEFFSQLAEILKGTKITLSAEMMIYDKFLWFFVTCPTYLKEVVKGQWFSHYPQSEIEEIKDYTQKLFFGYQTKSFTGCELYYDQPELLSLNTYKELEKNPLVSLSGIASSFTKDEAGIIQLVLETPKKENLWDRLAKKLRENNRQKISKKEEYIGLEEKKEQDPYFITTIRFITLGGDKEKVAINLSSMVAVYKKAMERPKMQKLNEDAIRTDRNFIELFTQRSLGHYHKRLATDELATFFHLPYKDEAIAQVIRTQAKKAPPPQYLPQTSSERGNDFAPFGETNFQNEKTQFGLLTEDRRRHLYVIGKTGMGKSKMLALLIKSDLEAGRGLILLDPHGDLAQEVLNFIPEKRMSEVVYFNPADSEYPIGFNPMEGVGSFEFKQNIVAGFIAIFKKIFGLNWNERFEHVLRYTTLALLDYPQASILGIPRMLTDNLFRQEVIGHIKDPLVKKFWTTEFASWNEQFANEAIIPIINKIGQFIANPVIRNIVGQAETGFSLEHIMNKEKILIANLAKGKLGEENSALLGSMLITKIWQNAIARATIPEEDRKDVFLYVDEFQNFATNAFGNILSEARKYRLNLTVAHQYMQQLSDEVRSTIFGNVGNMVSFRVGGEDAQILAKEFEPVFEVNDFLNLDLRNFFIKMPIAGKTTRPFSAQTITLTKPEKVNVGKLTEISRKKWAKTKKEAEEEIAMWESGELKKKTVEEKKDETFFPEPIV